jgi:hypothetical protein
MAFRASLFPPYPGFYWNNVVGTSPSAEIPDPGDTAPLLVNPSFWSLTPAVFYSSP